MDEERLATIDNYKALAAEVIKRAADEYVSAGKRRDWHDIKVLEDFFYSDEFILFTDGAIDPEYFIDKLKEKAKQGRNRNRNN